MWRAKTKEEQQSQVAAIKTNGDLLALRLIGRLPNHCDPERKKHEETRGDGSFIADWLELAYPRLGKRDKGEGPFNDLEQLPVYKEDGSNKALQCLEVMYTDDLKVVDLFCKQTGIECNDSNFLLVADNLDRVLQTKIKKERGEGESVASVSELAKELRIERGFLINECVTELVNQHNQHGNEAPPTTEIPATAVQNSEATNV